jgi:hypothetical protein
MGEPRDPLPKVVFRLDDRITSRINQNDIQNPKDQKCLIVLSGASQRAFDRALFDSLTDATVYKLGSSV